MKLLVSALEPSANVHLGSILPKDIDICGLFDDSIGNPDINAKDFAVMGFLDVISKIFAAKKAIKKLAWLSRDCDEALLIDAPAFNIPLAKALKKVNPNFKITYYILPKVWAWKSGRIDVVNRYTDAQAYIFPFEHKYWEHGKFVGNPLLKQIKNFRHSVIDSNITAFLPGSRASEIKKLMPVFKDLVCKIDGIKVIVIPQHFDNDKINELYGDLSDFTISKDAKQTLYDAKQAIVCSGTATLEAALIGVPFVLVYKAKKIDEIIARQFVKLKYVGLANILFDFENKPPMHAELLQDNVKSELILQELQTINPDHFLQKSFELRSLLSQNEQQIF